MPISTASVASVSHSAGLLQQARRQPGGDEQHQEVAGVGVESVAKEFDGKFADGVVLHREGEQGEPAGSDEEAESAEFQARPGATPEGQAEALAEPAQELRGAIAAACRSRPYVGERFDASMAVAGLAPARRGVIVTPVHQHGLHARFARRIEFFDHVRQEQDVGRLAAKFAR